MADPSLLNALVTVGFGAMAGGITNAVAIWMLFHPYERKGIGPLKLYGAIPKNKTRLARTIGRTVGQRLITPEDLAEHLASPKLQEAFDSALRSLVEAVLEQERGSLREELPPALIEEFESTFDRFAPDISKKIQDFAESDDFKTAVTKFVTKARTELDEHTLGELLTEDRRSSLKESADQWLTETVAAEGFENTIEFWLDRQIFNLANDHTPLVDRLPDGLVDALERTLAGYLPDALERLAETLGKPETRTRIEEALHELFEKFANDLLFHERIVAKLVVTERTISRMLDTFEKSGAEKIASLLEQPEMKDEIAHSITEAIDTFLRWPMSHHVDHLGHERVNAVKEAAQHHMIAALRDENTRSYAIDKLDQTLRSFEKKTWGELLAHLPSDKAAHIASEAAASTRVREWIDGAMRQAFVSILDKPIKRPGDWLDQKAVTAIVDRMSPVLWSWTQKQVPKIVAQIDVEHMVEEKVLSFSLSRIEELVRRTTQRELDIIIRLGYVLGAVVGTTAYVVSLILP